MGVLSRLNTLIKSNLNAAVDRMSNPAREIDILVAEMEDALKAARQEVQTNLASEKLAIKQRDRLLKEAKEWEDRAARAVHAGDDNLARQALQEKTQLDAQVEAAEKTLREQEAYVDQLTQSLKELEARVKEVKLRKNTLKQQAKMTAGKEGKEGGSAFADFERLSSKVDAMDAESQLDAELSALGSKDAEVDRKIRALDKGDKIDDALAELKKKLGQ
jgi:phage shock protein A